MKILVLNSGSSSIKFQMLDMATKETLIKGLVERIGLEESLISWKSGGEKYKKTMHFPGHKEGLAAVLDILKDRDHGVISDFNEIDAVGHRYVHGGEIYKDSAVVTEEDIAALEGLNHLAPLHNPHNLVGVRAMLELIPRVPNVIVFDTSFHSRMPEKAYMFALPYELYEKYGIRRYGFHGTSHHYVALEAASMINKPFEKSKIITCHMGNGTSFSAVQNGHSVDTSLGFSTMCGIPMGTRAGDFDPGILTHLLNTGDFTSDDLHDLIYKKSGMLGVSGISSDMRDIEQKAWNEKDKRAQLALDLVHYHAKKYIGAYLSVMNGADALVFTAGIGENGWETREEICSDMEFLGIQIDREKNKVRGKRVDISAPGSRVKVLVIPTNEELMIAEETLSLTQNR
ncbi:MAG TPA: acetate kinase [Firmicutes bacterium]|nr:acetate kinase [Bacillota bacterium]